MLMSYAEIRAAADHEAAAKAIEYLWPRIQEGGGTFPTTLKAKFPHVLEKIAEAWGEPATMRTLMEKDLLLDNRGNRQGFPFAAMTEIYEVYQLHQRLFPTASASSRDAWAKHAHW